MTALTTTPPERETVLYDGLCRFCTESAKRLDSLTRGTLLFRSYRDEGVLAAFPGLTREACDRALQFIRKDGRVFAGAEGVVRALHHRWFGRALLAYYAPGIRQLVDLSYRAIANNRFRIAGKTCEGGTCQLHVR